MEKTAYTTADIQKIFRVEEKYKSSLSVLNAEERGEIQKASRIQRGKTSVRQWQTDQLPDIEKKFGFLKNCKEQQILNVFLSKGGVGKSSFCFNLARTLAISSVKKASAENSKILIIGLDLQGTITDYTLPPIVVESLEEAQLSERVEQKNQNKEQASSRVEVEHVFTSIKRFKIISQKYRNRRRRFGLRFNLISAIHNLEWNAKL